MKKPGYYSSGEFARMAHVTLRTNSLLRQTEYIKTILRHRSGRKILHR